jgi:hypothetical protein
MIPRYEQLSLGSPGDWPECPGWDYCDDGPDTRPCPLQYEPNAVECAKVLHPRCPELGLRLAECQGLGFNVVARPANLPELPPYVPCVSPVGFIRGSLSSPAVAVPLDEVLSPKAQSTERGLKLRDRLGIGPETRLILIGFPNDQLLEHAWPRRHTIMRELADLRPDLATAFGYPVYENDTRLENLYNMKRSLLTYQLWQRYGVPAVPNISWFNGRDLDRWCDWLHSNTSVSMVAIDLQSVDTSRDWEFALSGLEYLGGNAPSTLSYFIYGVAKPDRVAVLTELIPRVHLSNQYPFMMAVQGHQTQLVDGHRVKKRSYRLRETIFRTEVEKMEILLHALPDSVTPSRQILTGAGARAAEA